MRRRVPKREILARLEALEGRLAQPTAAPLEGQQAIDLTRPPGRYEQPTLDEDEQP